MNLNEYDYINGNTAVKPRIKERESAGRRQKQIEKSIKQRNIRKNEKIAKAKKELIQVIACIFVLGLSTIYRDSMVYNKQNDIAKIDSEIKAMNLNNEALQVDIIKASSLNDIQTKAQKKLGLVMPKKDDVIKIDLSKNNFALNENASVNDTEKGLFEKIKNALW